jgi:hypothetical protein
MIIEKRNIKNRNEVKEICKKKKECKKRKGDLREGI